MKKEIKKQNKRGETQQETEIIFEILRWSPLVRRIRKKFAIPKNGWKLYDTDTRGKVIESSVSRDVVLWERSLTPLQKKDFNRRILMLMKRLRIPDRFGLPVRDFVKLDEFITSFDYGVEVERTYVDIEDGEDIEGEEGKRIIIKLSPDVRRKDLHDKELWRLIGVRRKELRKRGLINAERGVFGQRVAPHFNEMRAIYYAWRNGMSYREIREKAQTKLKWHIKTDEHVRIILHRYRKLISQVTRKVSK